MNKIVINPKADVMVCANRTVLVILDRNIISIADSTSNDVANMIERVYNGDYHVWGFSDELDEAILKLKELKVVVEEDVENEAKIFSFCPYVVNREVNNIWRLRRGEKIYYFIAEYFFEANKIRNRLLLSFIDEIEIGIFEKMETGECKVYPAKHKLLPGNKCKKIKRGEILIYDSITDSVEFHRFKNQVSNDDFWRSLILRAKNEIGLVPIAQMQSRTSEEVFPLSKHVCLSLHRQHVLDCSIENEWQIGIAETPELAMGKAIMESIERFCGSQDVANISVYDTANNLGSEKCLLPEEFAKYSSLQRKAGWVDHLAEFDYTKSCRWIKVKEYSSGIERLVPSSFISYGSCGNWRDDRFFLTSSNGMAAHTSLDEAIKRATLEIVERDSILVHWFNRISPASIEQNGNIPNSSQLFGKKIKKIGLELTLLDLTLDSFPVVLAFARGSYMNQPVLICGAASNESYHTAISKAVEELEFSLWSRLLNIRDLKKRVSKVRISNLCSPLDHEALYMRKDTMHHLNFLFSSNEKKDAIVLEKKELSFKDWLHNERVELYYCDLTHDEVIDLGLGISVVRVLLPEYLPITFGFGQEPLAMKRLHNLPNALGISKQKNTEEKIFQKYLPHFFA